MMFASIVWTSCNKEALERVYKRAPRIIVEAQLTSRTVTFFNILSWIPFYNEANIKRCELAHKWIDGTQSTGLFKHTSKKKLNSDAHARVTRYCNINLQCLLHRNISEDGRTFSVKTVKDWNNLPPSLKTKNSLKSFKAELWKIMARFAKD